EVVARDFILKDKPDIVINVIDATNLERGMYLTSQLLEMGSKVILALNMMDEAKAKNIEIDIKKLSKNLGVPVVATIASKRIGLDDLLEQSISYISKEENQKAIESYGEDLDKEILHILQLLDGLSFDYPKKWLAVKLLERDSDILNYIKTKVQ